MEHRYLFFTSKEGIEVCSLENDNFEKVKFKGESIYRGNLEDFWDEWEAKAGYIDETISKVDFCIIGNNIILERLQKYIFVPKTFWTKAKIEDGIKKLKDIDIKIIDTGVYHVKINGELKNIKINNEVTSLKPIKEKVYEAEKEEIHKTRKEATKEIEEPVKTEKKSENVESEELRAKEIKSIADYYKQKRKLMRENKK